MGLFKRKPQEDPIEKAQRLTALAFEALGNRELDEAAEYAAQLREMRFSSAFEIQALIELQRDSPQSAIEVLREGVKTVPQVWSLWQLLGNTLSDEGEYNEAMECYETALELDLANESRASLEFNRATLLGRLGQYEESLKIARGVLAMRGTAEEVLWQCQAMTLRALSHLGRVDELQREAQKLRADLEDVALENADHESLASAWTQGGLALLDNGQDWEAREWANRALAVSRTDPGALSLLRRSNAEAPKAEQCFQVILQGEVPPGSFEDDEEYAGKEMAFFAPFSVIAQSEDEARELALEFESSRWEAPLIVESSEFESSCESMKIGIWRAYGYCFFPRDEEK